VVLCGGFLVLLRLFSVCIGIYQVSQSRFSCANRGQIVVNCVAECGHGMAVRSRWRFAAMQSCNHDCRIARQSPGTSSYHQKPPNKPISLCEYPEQYDISIEYLRTKLLQVLRLRSLQCAKRSTIPAPRRRVFAHCLYCLAVVSAPTLRRVHAWRNGRRACSRRRRQLVRRSRWRQAANLPSPGRCCGSRWPRR
jgi:hypothetical protein